MSTPYTEFELSALAELANIGAGTAGTALSSMLGRSVDLKVPAAGTLEINVAVERAGSPEETAWCVVVPVCGDLDALAMLVFPTADADIFCRLLGVEPESETSWSALGEIGNIMIASYIGALAQMTGLQLDLEPPTVSRDMLGAVVGSVLVAQAGMSGQALVLDSIIEVEGESCSLSCIMLPTEAGVDDLLTRIGAGRG